MNRFDSQEFHQEMMQNAILLGRRARIHSPPNPWVGCVLVKEGRVVGEGFTQPPGSPHAEVQAIRNARDQAKGSSAYVTLEPCCHYGRTPPCVDSLVASGIKKVFIGIRDPDPKVQGQGIALLQQAGIEVEEGILSEQVQNELAPYIHQRTKGIPYCVLKAAISMDGKIATREGGSRWITSPEARQEVHRIRAESQAILIGSGTALKDRPLLTVRDPLPIPPVPPLRVVLDGSGKVCDPHMPIFDLRMAKTLMVTTLECPEAIQNRWKEWGTEVLIVDKCASGRGVDLHQVLQFLGRLNMIQVLIEGGGELISSFLRNQLANKLCLHIGNCVLGSTGIPLIKNFNISSIEEAPRFQTEKIALLGTTVCIDYFLDKKS